jgi:hypothetical protein
MRNSTLIVQFLFIGMLFTSLDVFSQTPLVYWNFNEGSGTVVKDSKSAFTGDLMEGTLFSSSEKIEGSSLSFNGTADYVQTNLTNEIQVAENITMMAWFKTNVTDVTQQHIFWIGDPAGNGWGAQQEINVTINHFNAALQTNNLCLFYGSSADTGPNNVNIVSSDAVFAPGEWHHISAVIKNMSGVDGPTEAALYLDGVLLTPYDWTTTTFGFANSNIAGDLIDRSLWTSPLRIGIGGTLTRAFNGYIDEVKIFTAALTVDQIKTAMKAPGATSYRSIKGDNQGLVYPSPVKDNLFINMNAKIHSLEIFNILGESVMIASAKSSINVSHLKKGVYFVRLNGENGSEIQKIVKQ